MTKRIAVLLLAALAGSIAIVEVRHRSRVLYAELQALQAERDALNVDWGRLLLEEGAWSQHQRIEAVARTRLGMNMPDPEHIVVIDASREPTP